MIPVLRVTDPAAARRLLSTRLGFAAAPDGRLAFGAAQVLVVGPEQAPQGMIELPLDHIAFSVADADALHRRIAAAGAALDARFTPDGPRDIPEFWDAGVRFVFFTGPDDAPFEFCARNGRQDADGHSHHALRVADPQATGDWLQRQGARLLASHVLAGPVRVAFYAWGGSVIEVFDEAPRRSAAPGLGWVGLVP